MPSKLKKAIGVVKDQTSISLAKVNNSSNLDVTILKATTHDAIPVDERYVGEVLQLVSSNKVYAAACAHAIAKRIGKTRNWIVALKSLMLVLQIFQDGDPYFPREVLHTMKRGAKILNLSSFRDDSNSSPWDYTAFVRTFSLYLDERLDCFLTGKLQRRFAFHERENSHRRNRRSKEPTRDMKPTMMLDRISFWQRLLDRAIATRPTGAAKTNRLVQIALYAIVRESFDLYRDISDGLALLLDSFFHLQYQSCVNAFQACVKASKQFEELSTFYILCKSIGIGRTSEYPSVQKISDELIETLQEFLKDQASFPANGRSPTSHLLLPAPPSTSKDLGLSSEQIESYEQSEIFSEAERDSEHSSRRTSFGDLMSVTETGTSPSISIDQEHYLEQLDNQSQQDDIISVLDSVSTASLVSFDDWTPPQQEQEQEQEQKLAKTSSLATKSPRESWELVLAEITTQPTQASSPTVTTADQTSLSQHQYNPFLHDPTEMTTTTSTATAATNVLPNCIDLFSTTDPTFQVTPTFCAQNPNETTMADPTFQATPTFCVQNSNETTMVAPTFQATPTFCAQNPNETTTVVAAMQDENDPFASSSSVGFGEQMFNGSLNQQNVIHEQQLWLQHQQKIIEKHMT